MTSSTATTRQKPLAAVVLAAGKGTRMKSALPKVLHEVAGRRMVDHVLAVEAEAGAARRIVVLGFALFKVRRMPVGLPPYGIRGYYGWLVTLETCA